MCLKRKPAYPLTDKKLTIHGRCYDVLAQANAAGEAVPRPYTSGGSVVVSYYDGTTWREPYWMTVADDGLFFATVPLGYGTYRLIFALRQGTFQGGRFGPFCRAGVFDQDNCTYTFSLRIEDIIQQVASPQLTGDIIIYVEGT